MSEKNNYLNLRFSQARGGLVDGHLDRLLEVGDHNRSERGVLGVNHRVVHGPEAMELEHVLVPFGDGCHLLIGLIADHMVHIEQVGRRPFFF